MVKKASIILNLARNVVANPTFASGGVLVAISMCINVLTLGYNIYIGRRLPFADFGIAVVLASTLSVLQVPLSAYTKAITQKAAYLWGKDSSVVPHLWHQFRRTSYKLSLALTMVWLLAMPLVARFYHLPTLLPLLLLAPMWVVSVTAAVDSGLLLGMHRFKQVAVLMLVETLLYFFTTVFFVEINLPQFLYLATPLSILVSFVLSWFVVQREVAKLKPAKKSSTTIAFPITFFWHSLVTKFSTVAFITLDVLFAKHFLEPGQAGRYVMVSVVGKMAFYASTLLGQFVVPVISKELGLGKSTRKTFGYLLLASAVMLAGIFVTFGIFGGISLPLLFGGKVHSVLRYVPLYLAGMCCFSLSTIIVTYYQTKEDFSITANAMVSAGLVMLGIGMAHKSVWQLSAVVAIAGFCSLLFALAQVVSKKLFAEQWRYQFLLLVGRCTTLFAKKAETLPKKIGTFVLRSELTHFARGTEYLFGLYTHGRKTVLAKYWGASYKTEGYWRLFSELHMHKLLTTVQKRMGKSDVLFPAFVAQDLSKTSIALVQEYIQGTAVNSKTVTARMTVFQKALAFLELLSKRVTQTEKRHLHTQSGAQMVVKYPVAVLLSVMAFPNLFWLQVQSFVYFVRNAKVLVSKPANVFAHRDLHLENMLEKNGKIYLIDYGYAAFTVEDYDRVATVILNWGDEPLRKKWLKTYLLGKEQSSKQTYFKVLALYVITLLLTSNTIPKENSKQYIEALQFWNKL